MTHLPSPEQIPPIIAWSMSINLTGASSTPANPATLPEGVLKKRVSFCADCPVTEVVEISHEYPYDYFYSSFDMEQ